MAHTPMEVQEEVRFAVVMYGGVSLAVYINGVAQELLRMVRATAPHPEDPTRALLDFDALDPRERVYRRAGQLLGGDSPQPPLDAPIRTRFIVDILSGTSAGGINAVFLAKALANDQPLGQLERLWIDEGDLGKLLADRRATQDLTGARRPAEPRALLSGERMYRKLLEALDGMEKARPSGPDPSPYAQELDLFVTATDIAGLTLGLRLADGVVPESRHRHVFKFRYRRTETESVNDFGEPDDPCLAFAARCTSSFPFAFEPVRIEEIEKILERTPPPRPGASRRNLERLRRFFPAYVEAFRDFPPPVSLEVRSFADGGYLDNKPFGNALDALADRTSQVPVARKLLFVEPKPESGGAAGTSEPPDAVENVIAALGLARYETIREDLERLLTRNRIIDRVELIVADMESDVWSRKPAAMTAKEWVGARTLTTKKFLEADWAAATSEYGTPWGAYRRLEVETVTDDVTAWLAQAAGLDPRSGAFAAIRSLVRAWRDRDYPETPTPPPGAPEADRTRTRAGFLFKFSLGYRLRRLRFVISRIDRIQPLGEVAERILRLQHGFDLAGLEPPARAAFASEFRTELRRLRRAFSAILADLWAAERALAKAGEANPLAAVVARLGLGPELLGSLLAPSAPAERQLVASRLLDERGLADTSRALDAELQRYLSEHMKRADAAAGAAFTPPAAQGQGAAAGSPAVELATETVRAYYKMFQDYDLISFPILHATEVGDEFSRVEVFRVSPRDARSLLDEEHSARRKLAGTALMNFGAFLDAGWRRNDVLWGTLDGAERLLAALLPGDSWRTERARLLEEAQDARLEAAIGAQGRGDLTGALAEAVMTLPAEDRNVAALRRMLAPAAGAPPTRIGSALAGALAPGELRAFFARDYEVNRRLDRRALMQNAARAVRITGQVLEGVANSHVGSRAVPRVLTRLGAVLWGLVEVAIPDGVLALLFRNSISLAYAFGLLLAALGAWFFPELLRPAAATLAAVGAVHLVVLLLRDVIHGRTGLWKAVVTVTVGAVIALAGYGAVRLLAGN